MTMHSWIMMAHEETRAKVVTAGVFSGNLGSALSMFTSEVLAIKAPTMLSLWCINTGSPFEPDLIQLYHREGITGPRLIEAERDVECWLRGNSR